MPQSNSSRLRLIPALVFLAVLVPGYGSATIVEIETNLGTFEVNLYDNDTPATVANFLAYVQNGDYGDSVIHRSIAGFIIQGGGLVTDGNAMLSQITQRPAVVNEPVFSNVRGTIAMAKLPSGPNTATNQWFINLANNAANLDIQNGGFTVFGEVTAADMTVVDAIAAVPTFNNVFGFDDFPLQNFDVANPVMNDNLIIVTGITVTDTTVDSAAGLNPPLTTRNNTGGGGGNNGGGGGGGGSLGWIGLCGLLILGRRRYRFLKTA